MVQISKFRWIEFEWDEHNIAELEGHAIAPNEAEECFYNRHEIFRNKKKPRRRYMTYKLNGKTGSGRHLVLIFFVKEKSKIRSSQGSVAQVRVMTGWGV